MIDGIDSHLRDQWFQCTTSGTGQMVVSSLSRLSSSSMGGLLAAYQNESAASRPCLALPPVMIGCQLPQPQPPPTGSVTRTAVSRI